MPKKIYIGVNDVARPVTKMYVGVGERARKIIKAYIGVNGKAKLFFEDNTATQSEVSQLSDSEE